MAITRRSSGDPLGYIRDDLLLNTQLLEIHLSACNGSLADATKVENVVEVIGQIYNPLQTLERHDALAVLDAMRDALQNPEHPQEKLVLMLRAVGELQTYLETCLSPHAQRTNPDQLLAVAAGLRDLCQHRNNPLESSGTSQLRELLGDLQNTISTQVEAAADQVQPWRILQRDLALLVELTSAQGWQQAGKTLERLQRIVQALIAGGAAQYGILVSGICNETLTSLRYALQSPDSAAPAVLEALRQADERLSELDTLLDLSTSAPPPTPAPPSSASSPFDFPALTGTPRSAAVPKTNQDDVPTQVAFHATSHPDPKASVTTDAAPPAADNATQQLIQLIGLGEADPEFAEIFLEEASGALAEIEESLNLWREDLHNQEALATIRRAFHTLKGSGRMVGTMLIGDFAWSLEHLLNQVLENKLPACAEIVEITAAATTALAPLVGTAPLDNSAVARLGELTEQINALPHRLQTVTAPTTDATDAVPQIFAPDSDAEFVEVFIEETHGQLQMLHEQIAAWEQDLEDRQALTIARRAFHTIKGSGRVVGAATIGDFAWKFEDLLNRALDGTLPVSTAMISLVGDAITTLEHLLSGEDTLLRQAWPQLALITASVTTLESQAGAPNIAPRSGHEPRSARSTVAAPTASSVVMEPRSARSTVTLPEPTRPIDLATVPEPRTLSTTAPRDEPRSIRVKGTVPLPLPSATPPPAPPQETNLPEPLVISEADQELVQAFQDEAAELLDASDGLLQRLADTPDDVELLNDLRRGMHTLKGSSRMAGIMTVGDLAHAAESVLDALGKSGGALTTNLLDTLQQALDHLNRMLVEAASGISPAPAVELISDLYRLADTVSGSEAPLTETVAVAEEVGESTTFQAMTELDQELVEIFQAEANEVLDSSDTLLLKLRDEPDNTDLLNNLRREMHTLKGSSRMAGFMAIGDVAHAAEYILDALGKGTLHMSNDILTQVQKATDGLHQMLEEIMRGAQPAPRPQLIEQLHNVLGESAAAEAPQPAAVVAPTAVKPTPAPERKPQTVAAPSTAAPAATTNADAIRVSAALLNTLVNQMGESSIFRSRIDQGVNAMSNNLNDLEQTIARFRRQVSQLATQAEARIQSRHDHSTKAHQQEFDPLELDRFTELQQLSRSLMEIADDLGNIGTTLGEHSRDITNLLDQQGKVNKEIQQGLMRTGMVRFGSISPRLRRVVRQAAQDLGKRAELLVSGEDAEVDRTVLENIVAPLEHMLRNCLAHGIETPERRRDLGKPEMGTITLSLRREGAELVLELNDDGAGLNFEAIRSKGEEKGFLLPGQPATSEELIALLMRPGFSTAAAVTQVSGRGVGMDVVSEAIRAMRGALLIETETGQGTRFIIRLPFSLAVTQALLVKAGQGMFAIPLLSIEVVTRLQEQQFHDYLTGDPVLHQYAERDYPVHNLGILLGNEWIVPFEEAKDRRPPTLLFRSAEALAALQVESVIGNQEIIVKPISPQFNAVPGLSGATVLGDGRVVVVLELAALVRNINTQRQKQQESRALRAARQETRQDKLTIMVIDDSITMRKVTARILERHNIKAVTAKDGLDAVAMLQTQIPDLAILDIEMPRMDGFEVVAHVRNQSSLRHLPIVMVTSRGGDKHRERAMMLGVNDYLTKPYQEEQLMNSIRTILGDRAVDLIT